MLMAKQVRAANRYACLSKEEVRPSLVIEPARKSGTSIRPEGCSINIWGLSMRYLTLIPFQKVARHYAWKQGTKWRTKVNG